MARVRYFAAAGEATGRDDEIRSETTLADLRAALLAEYPRLTGVLPRCALLVDGERVDEDAALGPDTSVDVLPPFAGG